MKLRSAAMKSYILFLFLVFTSIVQSEEDITACPAKGLAGAFSIDGYTCSYRVDVPESKLGAEIEIKSFENGMYLLHTAKCGSVGKAKGHWLHDNKPETICRPARYCEGISAAYVVRDSTTNETCTLQATLPVGAHDTTKVISAASSSFQMVCQNGVWRVDSNFPANSCSESKSVEASPSLEGNLNIENAVAAAGTLPKEDEDTTNNLNNISNCPTGEHTIEFTVGQHSCSITSFLGEASPGQYNYSRSRIDTETGMAASAIIGCNDQGKWDVLRDPHDMPTCAPIQNCTESSISIQFQDAITGNICFPTVDVPNSPHGEKKTFETNHADLDIKFGLVCSNGRWITDTDFSGASCPASKEKSENKENADEVADDQGSNIPDDSSIAANQNEEEAEEPVARIDNSDLDQRFEGNNSPVVGADAVIDEEEYLAIQITAAAAAFGAGGKARCKAGPKAASYRTYQRAFSMYHSTVIQNVDSYKDGVENLNEQMTTLVEQGEEGQNTVDLQRGSLVVQRETYDMQLHLYNDPSVGIATGKAKLMDTIFEAREQAIQEYEAMNNLLKSCDGKIDQALGAAERGCARKKVVETCDEDGTNCTSTQVDDPVEGSCAAKEMIPYASTVQQQLYDQQFNSMPSNLMMLSYDQIMTNFDRFISISLPEGEWVSPLMSCKATIEKMHSDYGVKCDTPQGDPTYAGEWGVPVEGNKISDLYLSVLNRNPDKSGVEFWTNEFNKQKENGASEEEALEFVRGHILASKENIETEGLQGQELINKRTEIAMEINGNASICENSVCQDFVPPQPSVDVDQFYASIEKEARFENLVRPDDETADMAKLKQDAFEHFNSADLQIGTPHGRMNFFPMLDEQIQEALKADNSVTQELARQKTNVELVIERVDTFNRAGMGKTVGFQDTGDVSEDFIDGISEKDKISVLPISGVESSFVGSNSGPVGSTVAGKNELHNNGDPSTPTPSGRSIASSSRQNTTLGTIGGSSSGISSNSAIRISRRRKQEDATATKMANVLRKFPIPKAAKAKNNQVLSESRQRFTPSIKTSTDNTKNGAIVSGARGDGDNKNALISSNTQGLRYQALATEVQPTQLNNTKKKKRISRVTKVIQPNLKKKVNKSKIDVVKERSPSSSEEEIQNIYAQTNQLDNREYLEESENHNLHVHNRDQNLFQIISRRYIITGLKRLGPSRQYKFSEKR